MPKLPALTPREVIEALEQAGFIFVRQRGSHRIFVKDKVGIVVPIHKGDLRIGTLRHIIKQSGLSVNGFLELL